MSTLKELIAQKAVLELKIIEVQRYEVATAIETAKALINDYGLNPTDLFPTGKIKVAGKQKAKVAPKYKDPASGMTWSGRGIAPKWLVGKDRSAYKLD